MSEVESGQNEDYSALITLSLAMILTICVLLAYVMKRNSFYYFPESAAAIFIGFLVGGIVKLLFANEIISDFQFQPDLFFFFLLPPIIFEAAYSVDKHSFFDNFWTISAYAFIGTILSTFVVGYCVYYLGLYGIVKGIDSNSPLEAFIFGSLISSIDPVATLSIMGNKDLNCNPLLYSFIFGESILNDAVAIVLFKTFKLYLDKGYVFDKNAIPVVLALFICVSLGSVIVGTAVGLICSIICKNTYLSKYPEFEISILFLFAYGSYSLAESIKLSGIMSLFFCGIALSHYNSYNLSSTSQITVHSILKTLSSLSEFFVYLYVGFTVFTTDFKSDYKFSAFCWIACMIGRLINIFPLSCLANLCRSSEEKISLKMQFAMWFVGLRGAISFALSLSLSNPLYVTTTRCIVIFTTTVLGGLTEPILNVTEMRLPVNGYEIVSDPSQHGEVSNVSTEKKSKRFVRSSFAVFDKNYMQPIFGGPTIDENAISSEDCDDNEEAKIEMVTIDETVA